MQDLPTSVELIETVATFLREKILPAVEGHTAFHTLVAANALDIVRRELEIAPKAQEEETHRLSALLHAEGPLDELNEKLCAAITEGTLSLSDPALVDHLWATTLTKLAIDQPKYSAYREESGD